MAIALVSTGPVDTAGSPTFGQATTAGNLLILTVAGNGSFGLTPPSGGWVAAGADAAGVGTNSSIFYIANCAAGVTPPSGMTDNTSIQTQLSEWSGADTASPVDKIGTSTTTSASPALACGSADAGASDLVIAIFSWAASKTGTATFADSWTPTGGSALTLGGIGATKGIQKSNFVAYLLNGHGGSAVDTDTETVTLSTGAVSAFAGSIASFGPAVVSTSPRPFLLRGQAINRAANFFAPVRWPRRLLLPA